MALISGGREGLDIGPDWMGKVQYWLGRFGRDCFCHSVIIVWLGKHGVEGKTYIMETEQESGQILWRSFFSWVGVFVGVPVGLNMELGITRDISTTELVLEDD